MIATRIFWPLCLPSLSIVLPPAFSKLGFRRFRLRHATHPLLLPQRLRLPGRRGHTRRHVSQDTYPASPLVGGARTRGRSPSRARGSRMSLPSRGDLAKAFGGHGFELRHGVGAGEASRTTGTPPGLVLLDLRPIFRPRMWHRPSAVRSKHRRTAADALRLRSRTPDVRSAQRRSRRPRRLGALLSASAVVAGFAVVPSLQHAARLRRLSGASLANPA